MKGFLARLATYPFRLAWRAVFGTAAERKGRRAELRVIRKLEGRGIPCLHDVYVKHKNGVWTQVDVICFLGDRIGVIEVKDYSGVTRVVPAEAVWKVSYGLFRSHGMRNPLWQNAKHIKALKGRFPGAWYENAVALMGRARGSAENVWNGVPDWMPAPEKRAAREAWDAIVEHDRSMDKGWAGKEHMAWIRKRI
ncbi:MAG: hypothetical protein VR70_11025 [Rhodospirillaceae bacterium BRH_c57]|nr:MAG: hypothetical protein VR70_11025 [Rhodospirillaceae bacterium BRH_c57]